MMRIEIEIPKEFEKHFEQDKFEDALCRLSADAYLMAGNYEKETAIMLIEAFKNSKPAYDVDKVVAELEEKYNSVGYGFAKLAYRNAIEIIKAGGVNDR